MNRPALALLLVGVLVTIGGLGASVATVVNYLGSPQALSSTTGLMVFYEGSLFGEPGTELVQYPPFGFDNEPAIVLGGIVLVLAALLIGAVTRSISSR